MALWEEAVQLTKVPPKKGKKKKKDQEDGKSQAKVNAERAATLAQDGQYSRAMQALNSAGMAPDTAATTEDGMRGSRSSGSLPPLDGILSPDLEDMIARVPRRFREKGERS